MNADDRAELRRLSEEASAGPWGVLGQYVFADEGRDGIAQFSIEPDSAFIAAARTAVPALLDALEHAEADSEKRGELVLRVLDVSKSWQERAETAEARIKAVRDVLDDTGVGSWTSHDQLAGAIRRALDA